MGAVLAWRNAVEAAGVSLSVTSEAAGLGVQSLLTPTIADVWRSGGGGAAVHRIGVDLGSPQPIRLVALAAPRDGVLPGAGASWRVRLSNVSIGGSDVANSGALPAQMPRGTLAWLADAALAARYVQVNLAGDAGDPYLQLGRLWLGNALVTARAASYGWQRGVQDYGSTERAPLSGVRNSQRGAVARTLDFSLANLPPAEAAALDDMALALGSTGQAVVSPFSGDLSHLMFGRLATPPAPAQPAHRLYGARIIIEEDC